MPYFDCAAWTTAKLLSPPTQMKQMWRLLPLWTSLCEFTASSVWCRLHPRMDAKSPKKKIRYEQQFVAENECWVSLASLPPLSFPFLSFYAAICVLNHSTLSPILQREAASSPPPHNNTVRHFLPCTSLPLTTEDDGKLLQLWHMWASCAHNLNLPLIHPLRPSHATRALPIKYS